MIVLAQVQLQIHEIKIKGKEREDSDFTIPRSHLLFQLGYDRYDTFEHMSVCLCQTLPHSWYQSMF